MANHNDQPTVLGHPAGLFTLFFAEMWERFSYYGMRALLVFYMIKGFLGYHDDRAYEIYGAYTALVYATPFIGGMLADKLLGARRAVILGGALMALGQALLAISALDRTRWLPNADPATWAALCSNSFFLALGLLIVGNGFFKPNISTIVGTLYPSGSPKRDAGFTIFYMGINLGAAMSPLLCGYVGEKFGWSYGFGLASLGMMVGLSVFVAPRRVTQMMIMGGALASAVGLLTFQNTPYNLAINAFVAVALILAASVAWVALERGGMPEGAGAPPDPEAPTRPVAGPLTAEWAVYLGALLTVPIIAAIIPVDIAGTSLGGYVLMPAGAVAFLWLFYGAIQSEKVERERLFVVFILMFFVMLFWAFFEQAGSSVNNFTDRNVARVSGGRVITAAEVGQTIDIEVTQEQLGYTNGDKPFTMTDLDKARKEKATQVKWTVTANNVGMGVGGNEMPASAFQAANAIFIVVLGLVFTALWGFLGKKGLEPSTPVKFSLGLMQLGLGFGSMWFGSMHADQRGMVWVGWLLLAYLLQTTGELCLSPVGLSMVTKLSPPRMVSTVMGAWFLSTAFSNLLAGWIAKFTGVHSEGGKETLIPPPLQTVHIYGDVFKVIAMTAIASGVFCLILSPLLKRWMHSDVVEAEPLSSVPEEEYGFTPPSTHQENP